MNKNSAYEQALISQFGEALWRLLEPSVKRDAPRPVFLIWPRDDRAVAAVNPLALTNIDTVLRGRFAHHLSTALAGRPVVLTNSRGVFVQIGYQRIIRVELAPQPLDLAAQPSPVSVPVGVTRRGPLWVPIPEMDAVLVGGARRMGKSRLVHAWIQALIHGGQARLWLWDGKQGQEFGRYASFEQVRVGDDLAALLAEIVVETEARRARFAGFGVTSLPEFNRRAHPLPALPVLVVVIDEAAFIPEACQPVLHDLIARCGAYGVHPVLATQRPDASAVQSLVKANLSTRVAFAVPTHYDSSIILGRPGAERLPKTPGRLLLSWKARLIQAQAFQVELGEAQASAGYTPGIEAVLAALAAEGREEVTIALVRGWINCTEWQARSLIQDMINLGLLVNGVGTSARKLSEQGKSAVSQRSQKSQ